MEFEVFKRKGGSWLGAARNWIKWSCIQGDSVEWGSNTKLMTSHGELTVKDVEDIAAKVGFAVYEKVVNQLRSHLNIYQAEIGLADLGEKITIDRPALAEKLQVIRTLMMEIDEIL